ncbi:hypothetical protein CEXT_620841 [Caerostris extrusa]|uniref:Uncharacterized protein n=1 Tax=Caerostris extrusa TaxID=172846 RepID=A0AAV4X7R0_CAEEX|nr:hypothetical protein CEXT_620841 [Caerostris extrusa]
MPSEDINSILLRPRHHHHENVNNLENLAFYNENYLGLLINEDCSAYLANETRWHTFGPMSQGRLFGTLVNDRQSLIMV